MVLVLNDSLSNLHKCLKKGSIILINIVLSFNFSFISNNYVLLSYSIRSII